MRVSPFVVALALVSSGAPALAQMPPPGSPPGTPPPGSPPGAPPPGSPPGTPPPGSPPATSPPGTPPAAQPQPKPGQPPPGQPPPGQPAPGTPPGQPPAGAEPAPGSPRTANPPAPGPSAGGLTAPTPIDPNAKPEKSDTEKELDEAKEEDSGRGLKWFYIDAEGGYQFVSLNTFEVEENLSAGLVENNASGGFVGAGLGLRLLFLSLGPRFRMGFFPDYQTISIGGELGFRFPVSFLEPHFELGGGYVALGSFGSDFANINDNISIRGGYGRISGGLDFFLGNYFTLGAAASWEFMGLTRPGVDLATVTSAGQATTLDGATQQALAADGSSYGSAVTVGAKLGLHF